MEHASIMNKKRRVSDQLLEALIYLCAFLAVGLLLGIIGYVFWRGFRTVNWSFLVTEQSPTQGDHGYCRKYCEYPVYCGPDAFSSYAHRRRRSHLFK